ncbi:hypothetical protein HG537_0E02340 [Torulaspora globosa]|uniref:tRNA:m(4)X modification enzyme TRM13 n=1 Tax=Torulaspora globosa TaxID=48254 RepID=A0A7H9HUC3_9SACH|nr:hypothetical protein HG537_0E02340 [Torulaspora sp. CBS 2947]
MVSTSKCGFYMNQKRRYCGMTTKTGSSYCLEHLEVNNGTQDEKRRVPCPLDPNHTVWASNLGRHVKKCNKLKLLHVNDNEPFYVRDCNVLRGDELGCGESPHPNELVIQSIPALEQIYAERFLDLPLQCKSNEYMESHRCAELVSNRKHALQQSSLIQHMLDQRLLQDTRFIEFGCGRAELSRYIHQVALQQNAGAPPSFTLIDRASNRMKFDSKFKEDFEKLRGAPADAAITRRCKIDIKDLKLDPLLDADRDEVAVSKHLCGVATDLTLRCIANSDRLNRQGGLKGVCIAMCCRHVCDPDQYVNRPFIESLLRGKSDLSYRDFFNSLRKMCSWATSGRREGLNEHDIGGHFTNLPLGRREQLGLMARRIIDEGRRQWVCENLTNRDYAVELIKYTTPDVSLENVAMLVYTK